MKRKKSENAARHPLPPCPPGNLVPGIMSKPYVPRASARHLLMMKKEKRLLARFAMLVLPKHAVLCPPSDASKQEKKSEITDVVIRMREHITHAQVNRLARRCLC